MRKFSLLFLVLSLLHISCAQKNLRIRIVKDSKYGLITEKGEIIIDPQYSFIDEFHNGLAVFSVNGKFGFLDKDGNVLIQPSYAGALTYNNGLIVVNINEQAYYINKEEEVKYGPFENAETFKNGLGIVKKENLWGCIDEKGEFVIQPAYDHIEPFYGSYTSIKLDGHYGVIHKSGKIIVPLVYDMITVCTGGMFLVKKDSVYGYVDSTNKVVIPLEYSKLGIFNVGFWDEQYPDLNHRVTSYTRQGKSGYLNRAGKEVALNYSRVNAFSENLATAQLNGTWGVIDTSGKLVVPAQFIEAEAFSEGLALVRTEKKEWQFIDKTGKVIIELHLNKDLKYPRPRFEYGLAFIPGNKEIKIINKKGETLSTVNADVACRIENVEKF